jgi:hypothetical protein
MQRIRDDRGLADLDAGRLTARKSGAASRSRALTPKQRYGGEGSAWDEEREDGEHPFPLALIKTAWDLLIIYNFIAFRPGGFGMLGPELLTGAAMQRILSALVLFGHYSSSDGLQLDRACHRLRVRFERAGTDHPFQPDGSALRRDSPHAFYDTERLLKTGPGVTRRPVR